MITINKLVKQHQDQQSKSQAYEGDQKFDSSRGETSLLDAPSFEFKGITPVSRSQKNDAALQEAIKDVAQSGEKLEGDMEAQTWMDGGYPQHMNFIKRLHGRVPELSQRRSKSRNKKHLTTINNPVLPTLMSPMSTNQSKDSSAPFPHMLSAEQLRRQQEWQDAETQARMWQSIQNKLDGNDANLTSDGLMNARVFLANGVASAKQIADNYETIKRAVVMQKLQRQIIKGHDLDRQQTSLSANQTSFSHNPTRTNSPENQSDDVRMIFVFNNRKPVAVGPVENGVEADVKIPQLVLHRNEAALADRMAQELPGHTPFVPNVESTPTRNGDALSRMQASLIPRAPLSPQSPRAAIFNRPQVKDLSSGDLSSPEMTQRLPEMETSRDVDINKKDKSENSLASTQLNNRIDNQGTSARGSLPGSPIKSNKGTPLDLGAKIRTGPKPAGNQVNIDNIMREGSEEGAATPKHFNVQMLNPAPWGPEAPPITDQRTPLQTQKGAQAAGATPAMRKGSVGSPEAAREGPSAVSRHSIFSLNRGGSIDQSKKRLTNFMINPRNHSPALSPDSADPNVRLSELGTPPNGKLHPQYATPATDAMVSPLIHLNRQPRQVRQRSPPGKSVGVATTSSRTIVHNTLPARPRLAADSKAKAAAKRCTKNHVTKHLELEKLYLNKHNQSYKMPQVVNINFREGQQRSGRGSEAPDKNLQIQMLKQRVAFANQAGGSGSYAATPFCKKSERDAQGSLAVPEMALKRPGVLESTLTGKVQDDQQLFTFRNAQGITIASARQQSINDQSPRQNLAVASASGSRERRAAGEESNVVTDMVSRCIMSQKTSRHNTRYIFSQNAKYRQNKGKVNQFFNLRNKDQNHNQATTNGDLKSQEQAEQPDLASSMMERANECKSHRIGAAQRATLFSQPCSDAGLPLGGRSYRQQFNQLFSPLSFDGFASKASQDGDSLSIDREVSHQLDSICTTNQKKLALNTVRTTSVAIKGSPKNKTKRTMKNRLNQKVKGSDDAKTFLEAMKGQAQRLADKSKLVGFHSTASKWKKGSNLLQAGSIERAERTIGSISKTFMDISLTAPSSKYSPGVPKKKAEARKDRILVIQSHFNPTSPNATIGAISIDNQISGCDGALADQQDSLMCYTQDEKMEKSQIIKSEINFQNQLRTIEQEDAAAGEDSFGIIIEHKNLAQTNLYSSRQTESHLAAKTLAPSQQQRIRLTDKQKYDKQPFLRFLHEKSTHAGHSTLHPVSPSPGSQGWRVRRPPQQTAFGSQEQIQHANESIRHLVRKYNKDLTLVQRSTDSVHDSVDSGYSSSHVVQGVRLEPSEILNIECGRVPRGKPVQLPPGLRSIRVCRVAREGELRDVSTHRRSEEQPGSQVRSPQSSVQQSARIARDHQIPADPLCLPGPIIQRITANKGTATNGESADRGGAPSREAAAARRLALLDAENGAAVPNTLKPLLKMVQIAGDAANSSTPASPAWQPWTREQEGGDTLMLRWSKQQSIDSSPQADKARGVLPDKNGRDKEGSSMTSPFKFNDQQLQFSNTLEGCVHSEGNSKFESSFGADMQQEQPEPATLSFGPSVGEANSRNHTREEGAAVLSRGGRIISDLRQYQTNFQMNNQHHTEKRSSQHNDIQIIGKKLEGSSKLRTVNESPKVHVQGVQVPQQQARNAQVLNTARLSKGAGKQTLSSVESAQRDAIDIDKSSKSRLRDIVTNAEINLGDVKPDRDKVTTKESREGGDGGAGSPGIDTEHLNPSFLANASIAENSIQHNADQGSVQAAAQDEAVQVDVSEALQESETPN